MLLHLLHAAFVSLCAAVAVDLGFRLAFFDDSIAYLVTLYTTLLISVLVGRRGEEHWSRRVIWRLPCAVFVAFGVVLSSRTWASFSLELGDGWQSGYSPYFVLIVSGVLLVALLELAARFTRRRVIDPAPPRSTADPRTDAGGASELPVE